MKRSLPWQMVLMTGVVLLIIHYSLKLLLPLGVVFVVVGIVMAIRDGFERPYVEKISSKK